MKKITLLNTLFSTIAIIAALSSCSKDEINNEKTPEMVASDFSYKEKLQTLMASNNESARQSGLIISTPPVKTDKQFASYKEAYEFFALLKKGVTSHEIDTLNVTASANKNMSTMAATSGYNSYGYNVACDNTASISGTWGTGTMAATWNVSGNLVYSWTQFAYYPKKLYTGPA